MHDLHPEYIKKIILHISKKNTEDDEIIELILYSTAINHCF